MLAPDIGSLVDYSKRKTEDASPWDYQYRVDGWVRFKTIEIPEWLRFDGESATKQVQVWCTREEATHVSLVGVCGALVPVEDVTVTGMVDWPEKHLAQARRDAMSRIGRPIF